MTKPELLKQIKDTLTQKTITKNRLKSKFTNSLPHIITYNGEQIFINKKCVWRTIGFARAALKNAIKTEYFYKTRDEYVELSSQDINSIFELFQFEPVSYETYYLYHTGNK